MTLNTDQQKRFEDLLKTKELWFENLRQPNWETIQNFLASELQLERERLLTALRESANVFFREHDQKPCDCLMRYVEQWLKNAG